MNNPWYINLYNNTIGKVKQHELLKFGNKIIKLSTKSELNFAIMSEEDKKVMFAPDPAVEAWDALSPEESVKRIKLSIEKTRPLIRSLLGPIPKEFLIPNKKSLN